MPELRDFSAGATVVSTGVRVAVELSIRTMKECQLGPNSLPELTDHVSAVSSPGEGIIGA